MRYAMVAINRRYDDEGSLLVRRVLISYTQEEVRGLQKFYSGTKLLAKDPYFEREGASHKYQFFDDGYTLIKVSAPDDPLYTQIAQSFVDSKRPYHVNLDWFVQEFECDSDEQAIKIFNDRPEKR